MILKLKSMGKRFRLRASRMSTAGFTPEVQFSVPRDLKTAAPERSMRSS
jgi:hypothetical protein